MLENGPFSRKHHFTAEFSDLSEVFKMVALTALHYKFKAQEHSLCSSFETKMPLGIAECGQS